MFSFRISLETGKFLDTDFTFGGQGDSFYEYLFKSYLLSGKNESEITSYTMYNDIRTYFYWT